MNYERIKFVSLCPNRNCQHEKPGKVIEWRHDCLSYFSTEWLDNKGYITCNHDATRFFILDAYFDCEKGINGYKPYSYTSYINIISALLCNPETNESDLEFLEEVAYNIKQKAKKDNYNYI